MWDDFALFSIVARQGSLTAAAAEAGVSVATLSRRMTGLEAALGRPLFQHGRLGYALTSEGRELLRRTERMEAAAADITAWRDRPRGKRRVRISAGTWTSLMLARHLEEFWRPEYDWVPEFLQSERDMDIARREIDIGVRNRRPNQPWLAGRRTGSVEFAVYGRDADVMGWIGAAGDRAVTPSAQWTDAHHGDAVVTRANEAPLGLAMAQAGIGRMVLPTFVGDLTDGLIRLDAPIDALGSERWLVCHHEGRHDPPIRHAITALAGFLAPTGQTRP
ncbi:LysR family transcriptional regulator [Hasllibacter sp. MH4015]|uniref:LysR family transcriptional regulator n=1 Tax=Hasllibacter sp. MH4015 TaxID=2854029 RepID=UPI001CD2B55D|nr:LysR family transcriptional regulator [Hasllibacter sp. MH4015]